MMDLDEMVNGTPATDTPKVEAEVVEQAAETHAEQPAEDGAPTAPVTDSRVPLAALEAVRGEKNDWKGRHATEAAARASAETEARMLREELARERQGREQQPQQPADPLQAMQQQIVNERFNTSEMIVRQQHQDVDDKIAAFQEAARANPALQIALQQQRHPWDFAYKEGQRLLMLKEVGSDPVAYRAKVEAEIRASMQQPVTTTPLNVPRSLAGERSVATRSAPAFTGPTPLDQIVNFR